MDTKWKNIKSKAKSFLEKCWLSSTGIAVKLFCFVLAGFGIAFWYSVVVYRTYHPTGESLFFGILGNALFGAGQMILTAFLIMRKFREWDPGEKDAYVKWQNRWKIRNRRLQWIGGTALLIALWYMSYLMNGGMYIGTGWQYNYASGYVMILSALVQFVLAGAVMNHFKKKQLDMIMCNFEKINQNRIKEALEIERKSLEKVSRSDQLRVDLVTNVSHDLKTPITAIKGYVEGIMDGVADTPEKMERYIKTIYNKANDMNRLINELTYYSGIDSNRIPYNFHRINVAEFFQDCVEDVGLDLESKDIELNYSNLVDPDTRIIADPEQLKKVINNIIGNSIKYIDKPKGIINIRILDEVDSIRVEIDDNGKGIAAKDLGSIFERFYRTDASRNSAMGGSGIGLSIVKKIIEDHGGYIWATSKEGEGTCLHFVIRKYREAEENE